MPKYNHVPFTSNLQMWSPSSSIDFNITTFPYTAATVDYLQEEQKHYYHHEPIFYPVVCMLCGLFHHPIPQIAATQTATTTTAHCSSSATSIMTAVITPAPSESSLPPVSPKKQPRVLSSRRASNRSLSSKLKVMYIKVLKACHLVVKSPFTRRHNIYPIQRQQRLSISYAENDGRRSETYHTVGK